MARRVEGGQTTNWRTLQVSSPYKSYLQLWKYFTKFPLSSLPSLWKFKSYWYPTIPLFLSVLSPPPLSPPPPPFPPFPPWVKALLIPNTFIFHLSFFLFFHLLVLCPSISSFWSSTAYQYQTIFPRFLFCCCCCCLFLFFSNFDLFYHI